MVVLAGELYDCFVSVTLVSQCTVGCLYFFYLNVWNSALIPKYIIKYCILEHKLSEKVVTLLL